MTPNEYQNLAMRTNDKKSTDRALKSLKNNSVDFGGVLNGCLGLSGETGEFCDMIKKVVFHEKEFDEAHAKKELGDCLWYAAMISESFRWNLEEIMEMNVQKLKARYPEGFDTYLSSHRKEGDV